MFTIPDPLKAALRQADCGALTTADDRGQVHVFIKPPHQDMRLLEGPLPNIHWPILLSGGSPNPRHALS